MTEQELRERFGLLDLPVYDEKDDRCETLTRCFDTAYTGELAEADNEIYLQQLRADPAYEMKGAIRYSATDVRPIFWKKRSEG